MLCTVSHDSHIESKTSWFIASHDAYHTFVIAYMTIPSFICPLPVMGTHYARAKTDCDGERKRDPVKCKLYDVRCPATRKGLPKCHVMEKVDNLTRKEIPPPFSFVIKNNPS